MHHGERVAHIGRKLLLVLHQLVKYLLLGDGLLVIEVLERGVFDFERVTDLLFEGIGIVIQLVDLKTDLGILVGIEGRNAALGGTEGIFAQTLLLVAVERHMIRHHNLRTVGNDNVRFGNAAVLQLLHFLDEVFNAERNAVADDVGDVPVEHTGGKLVQCKLAVVVNDRVSGVGSALKADDHITVAGEHIGDLALALVAPVCAYDCFNHVCFSFVL